MKRKIAIVVATVLVLLVAFFIVVLRPRTELGNQPAQGGGGVTSSPAWNGSGKRVQSSKTVASSDKKSYGIAQWYPWLREFCAPPSTEEKNQYLALKNRSIESLVYLAMLDFPYDADLLKEARNKEPNHPLCLYLKSVDTSMNNKDRIEASLALIANYPNDKMLKVLSSSLLLADGQINDVLENIRLMPVESNSSGSLAARIKGDMNDVLRDLGRNALQSQARTFYQSRSLVSNTASLALKNVISNAQKSQEPVPRSEISAMLFLVQQRDSNISTEDTINSTTSELNLISIAKKLGYENLYDIPLESVNTQIWNDLNPIIDEQHFFDLTPESIEKMDDTTKEKFFRRVEQFGELEAIKWYRNSMNSIN